MYPVISIKNLDYYFGERQLTKQVLFDINLEVSTGEIVIITGHSGSGKTTLLTLIGGLRSAQIGSLKVLGKELCNANAEQLVQARRKNGYIFQGYNLHRSLTAIQNVKIGLETQSNITSKEIHLRAAEILQKVGLEKYLDYYPDKLSGGQKQRIAIARALVSDPQILLADEPTAALDSQSGREVVNLMEKLAQEKNCTIVIVTHDNRILDIADRIISMEDGKIQTSQIISTCLYSHSQN